MQVEHPQGCEEALSVRVGVCQIVTSGMWSQAARFLVNSYSRRVGVLEYRSVGATRLRIWEGGLWTSN